MFTLFSTLAIAYAASLGLMTLVWLASIPLRDVSIIDRFWGVGLMLMGWIYFFLAGAETTRNYLVVGCVTLWGVRLSLYITWRNWNQPEDERYREMREARGDGFIGMSLWAIFWLQASLLWVISLPLLQAQRAPVPEMLTVLDGLAIIFFAVGFFFETVGDWQLARFKANPNNQGKVLNAGLWRYTRHPNYFGELMMWWGFFLFALATPKSLWTIVSPLLLTIFILRVSGVTLLEKNLSAKKPEYREYVKHTSALIPWFPAKQSEG